jgi:hypothetical protein
MSLGRRAGDTSTLSGWNRISVLLVGFPSTALNSWWYAKKDLLFISD